MSWHKLVEQAQVHAGNYRFADPGGPALGKAGFHGSALAGSSLEYKDFREYQPGDDLRYLDWSAYARSDRLMVKRYHDEVTPHVDLLLDGTRSLHLPDTAKGEAAQYLLAFFASVAHNSSYTCRGWSVTEACHPLDMGKNSESWPEPTFDGNQSPGPALVDGAHTLRRQGVRILITDTLWPDAPRPILAALSTGASMVLVVRLLASSDLRPEPGGYARLQDSETGEVHQLLLDRSVLAGYGRALDRHLKAWDETVRALGVHLTTLEAEAFMERPVFADAVMNHVLTIKKG